MNEYFGGCQDSEGSNKDKWLHPEEVVMNGKVTYHVKFVGVTEVDDARGMDVVRQAMQKLKFSRHIKRSEGSKPPKVDLTINVDGLQVIDQRSKTVLHSIPLQRVSFCADDKQDKRLFSFIAKGSDGKQYCYGFDSLHEANNITLTIGQAFELAYEKFLRSDKAVTSKQVIELSKRIEVLEKENSNLKQRIRELESAQQQQTMYIPLSPSSQSAFQPFFSVASDQKRHCDVTRSSESAQSLLLDFIGDAGQSLLDTSSVAQSSANQTQAECKVVSKQAKRVDIVTKQSSNDQTIASVEKAKKSLNNLKEYARRKKLEKELNNPARVRSLVELPSTDRLQPLLRRNDKPLPEPLIPVSNVSTSYHLLPMPSPESYFSKLKRHNSADSLSTIPDSSFNTFTQSSKPEKTTDLSTTLGNKKQQGFNIDIDQDLALPESITNLPETEIGDIFRPPSPDTTYQNTISERQEVANDEPPQLPPKPSPPPLPPKPPNMLEWFSAPNNTESLRSDSITDVTSLEAISGCSFTLCPVADHTMDERETPTKDLVSATMDRLAGEYGYMKLKASRQQIASNPYIDSTYDSVFQLMESIRAAEMFADPNIPVKDVSIGKQAARRLKPRKDASFSPRRSDKSQSMPSSKDLRKAHAVPPLPQRNNRESLLCAHTKPQSKRSRVKKPQFLTSPIEKFRLQTPPAVAKKDVFDMQPFTPPPTTPTFVRLPSPNEVFPLKSPSRRSPSKSKDVFERQASESSNLQTPPIPQSPFDRFPVFASSLNAFDPLKSP